MHVTRAPVNGLILWLLALTTAVTLGLNIPSAVYINRYVDLIVIYALLTAFALYFGTILSEGEFGSAHAVGVIALLSLPEAAQPTMVWAIALGGMAGGLLLVARSDETLPHRPLTTRSARSVIAITARVTLSFLVSAKFYVAIGGRLPVQRLTSDEVLPLALLGLVYGTVYFLIFLLETYMDGRSVARLVQTNRAEILIVLALPIPFALLGAEVYSSHLSMASFAFLIAGLTLMMFGQYTISRAQYRLRSQVDEWRTLSMMSQTMSAKLKMDALVKMIYEQVTRLLPVDNFMLVLYEPGNRRLRYPLVMRNGEQDTAYAATSPQPDGLLAHVLKTQSPLLISHDAPAFARQLGITAAPSISSWLGVPLIAGGHLLGAIVITGSESARRFSSDDLRLLKIVSASASIAIENAQFYEQQAERANQLSMLNRVVSLLTGTLSPDSVLDTVTASATQFASASAAAVYLFWDDDATTLAITRSIGLSEHFTPHPPDPILLAQRRAQIGEQQPIIVTDAMTDNRAASMQTAMAQEGVRSWIELPLTVGGFGLGVLALYYHEAREFSDEQVELYRAFATQAAQAIANARLFAITDETLERRVGQLLALASIGHELTAALDKDTICELALSHSLDATNATSGIVMLLDEKTHLANVSAQRGYPEGTFANPALLNEGITGRVVRTGNAALVPDVSADADYMPLMPTTRSQLTVPIQQGRTVSGLITLESNRTNAFNEDDSQFLMQIANQAVIALDNAQLFQRIAEGRDRLQVILDAMSEAIVLIGLDGAISLASPQVSLIGLKPEQLSNQALDDLLEQPTLDLAQKMGFRSDQDVRRLVKEARAKAWGTHEPTSYPLELGGNSVFVQRRVIPVRGDGEQIIGVLLVFYDQTEQFMLAQTRENLSNMIVHDLRSPLTAVTTSFNLLNAFVPSDSDFRPVVEKTTEMSRRAIRKILGRVDSLLDVARMESGHLATESKPASLASLLENACLELNPLAQELKVNVVTNIPDGMPRVNVDADKIERVFLNLLDNALKYSPSNATIRLYAHAPGTDGAPSGYVRVDVIDMGPGIPEDFKPRLFDRFVQVQGSSSRRGSGLGLTFCKMAVEAHGGRIWVEDNPQGGTIFALTLPCFAETRIVKVG